MYLTFEVISANAALLGDARRSVFSVEGGRIGRAAENDMVLPGAGVHRHHATVRFINGVFFIEGVGANGIAVNNPDVVLPRNEPYPLKSGDKVYIDEYEVVVTTSATPPAAPTKAATLRTTATLDPLPIESNVPHAVLPSESLIEPSGELDPLRGLNTRAAAMPAHTPPPQQAWNHSSALSDHFAPAPVASINAIPEDWDKTSFNRSKLQPQPPQPPPSVRPAAPPSVTSPAASASPAGSSFDWEAFLRAAGVDPATVPADTAAVLGHIMRTVVQGLIEVLRARSEIKTEFRMPVTQVRVSENNPLKFAANAEDALLSLFGRRNSAYLPPQEAFEDAFNDVRFHQLAMLAGVRAGFDHLMSRFDPDRLAESFDKNGRRGLFGNNKAKNWELYEERYRELAKESDETFRHLFGEEFARAYEQQLAVLKRARAKR
jgi:type VI secretion system protein ImpI